MPQWAAEEDEEEDREARIQEGEPARRVIHTTCCSDGRPPLQACALLARMSCYGMLAVAVAVTFVAQTWDE